MSGQDREKVLRDLNSLINTPGGSWGGTYILQVAGAFVPALSAIASMSSEYRQGLINETMSLWASLADSQIIQIRQAIDSLSKEISPASLSLLLGEVLGDHYSSRAMSSLEVCAALNPSTVQELEPFIAKSLISITPTHSSLPLGSGNSVGNEVEDQKRPYGRGEVFVLKVAPYLV